MNKEEKQAYDNLKMLQYFTMEKEDKQSIAIILNCIDKLEKENQKLRDVKNKAIGHINCCKTSLGNYLLSPSEVECLLDILKEGDIE